MQSHQSDQSRSREDFVFDALVKESHAFIRKLTTLGKPTIDVTDMDLKFVSVGIQEVDRSSLTAILSPFDDAVVAQTFRENVELVSCNVERIMCIVGGGL